MGFVRLSPEVGNLALEFLALLVRGKSVCALVTLPDVGPSYSSGFGETATGRLGARVLAGQGLRRTDFENSEGRAAHLESLLFRASTPPGGHDTASPQ